MSAFDVSETAKEWLAAIEKKERAEEAFRDGTAPPDSFMQRYKAWEDACKLERALQRIHLAALKDAPGSGLPDDARIQRLRVENQGLAENVRRLRMEVDEMRKKSEEKNRELDAMHYVWCSGGCEGGTHRWEGSPDDVTEEIVALAERNTGRLRAWFENRKSKLARRTT